MAAAAHEMSEGPLVSAGRFAWQGLQNSGRDAGFRDGGISHSGVLALGWSELSRMLLIVNDPPYGTERAYDALRLAINVLKQDSAAEMRVFLVGDGAQCAKAGQAVPSGYYNVELMLKSLAKRGATIGVCGTCMDARGLKDADLAQGTRRSSLDEMTEWTLWANKVLAF